MTSTELVVEGMSCGHCAQVVTGALQQLPGVTRAQVDLETGRARVEYDEGQTGVEELVGAVVEQGYSVRPTS